MEIEDFKKYLEDRFENKRTIDQYFSVVKNFPLLRITNDEEILIHGINKYITAMPSSSTRLYAMKHWLQFVGLGHLCYKLRRPPVTVREDLKKSITFGLIRNIIDATDDMELQLIFRIMYDTASRIGGVLSIERRNIEKDDDGMVNVMFVEKRKQHKTSYVSTETGELLFEFIKGMKKKEKVFKKEYKEIYRELSRISKDVLGFHISTHWFRHSRAIHLFQKGHSIFTIQRTLGHKSIDSTRHYLEESGIESKLLMKKEEPKWS